MSDLYDQEVRDALREVEIRFEVSAREKARQTLVEVFEVASEVLSPAEIRTVLDETLGA